MAQLSTTTEVQVITSGAPINNERFQGWYSNSEYSSWEDINCPTSESLITTGNFAQCCSFGATTCSTMWTACVGNTAVGVNSDPCVYCGSMSIYDQYPAADQTPVTEIVCGNRWLASTIYRRIVISSTVTSVFTLSSTSTTEETTTMDSTTRPTSITSSVSRESPGTTPAAVTPLASSESSDTTPTATALPAPNQSSGTVDIALIAGAVVGPVIAIILIALALWFFCFRKRRRPKEIANTGTTTPHYTYYNEISGSQKPDIGNQPLKYHQTQSYEMPSYDDRVHELTGDSTRR